ncbi:MAG: N-acyl-D-amino-acid deacylase [Bacillota bacterium]|nr:N-acyl-D-amino-acid deacylase [Bacillota bacterium]MDK2960725.1 N-acyl-D-amino-acid deacylase [Bacillota bacterium]
MLDVVIKNGRVIDGAGNPWFRADVGIAGERIVEVRHTITTEAHRVIDATGLVVAPGFIDMHTHSDLRVFKHPEEDAKLMQGITTALIGQDGLSVAPIDDANKEPMKRRVSGLLGTYLQEWPWNSMADYLAALDKVQPATNSMMLVPHGAVRAMVVGWENRAASPSELERMKDILAQAMEEGGCGFSTGLIYPPGMYADRRELVELCRVTAKYGGFFVVHMRNEGDYVLDSIREVTGICLEAGCPLHISHLKVGGRRNWGKAPEVLALLEEAREQGLEVTFDQYPYVAGSTMLDAVIPPRFHAGGTAKLLESLKDPAVREEIRQVQENIKPERWENWVDLCGWDGIMVNAVQTEKNRFAEGKTITEIAKETGKTPLDVVCDLLIEEEDAVTMTVFYGSEEDVKTIMRSEYMTLCSDGIVGGKPHPRVYGTCARFLGKYVREEKVLTLPQAVRRMTSAAAQRLGLQDRGLIREGMVADITVFNPETIRDKGTFSEPNQYPEGIEYVLVAGQVALDRGRLTGVRAGRALRRR